MSNDERTVKFQITSDDPDWTTNDSGYEFGTQSVSNASITVTKYTDRILELKITGLSDQEIEIAHPLPPDCPHVLDIEIRLKARTLWFYFAGKLVGEVHL